jgi:hypothetical protein
MAFKIANAHASPNPKSALFALDAGKPHAPAHHAQRERRADERDRQEDANADQHDEWRELTPRIGAAMSQEWIP